MIGFTFRNIHSSTFRIGVKSVDRSLIPELRRNEFTIPGRHGTLDFGLNTYEKRPIQVRIGLLKNADWQTLRAKARDVARLAEKYGIRHHQGYNFFPRTPHIEHLVVLDLVF